MGTESGDVLGKTAVFTAVPGPRAHEFAGGAVHSGRLGVSEEGAGFSFEHAKKCVGANDGFELGLFWRGQLTLGALGSEFVVSGLRLSVGLDADERAGEFEGETPRERSVETDEKVTPILTIEVHNARKEVRQVRGECNRRATERELDVLRRWNLQEGLAVLSYL